MFFTFCKEWYQRQIIDVPTGKEKQTLPNIMFDITAKDLADITDLPQRKAGYTQRTFTLLGFYQL